MSKKISDRIKKMLGISLLVFFVVSMAAVSVCAQASTKSDQGSTLAMQSWDLQRSLNASNVGALAYSDVVTNPCAPFKVKFKITPPIGVEIKKVIWYFGDNRTQVSNESYVVHNYTSPGYYESRAHVYYWMLGEPRKKWVYPEPITVVSCDNC